MTPRPPRKAFLFGQRNRLNTVKARQANCDHVYEQATAGKHKDSWLCIHCGKIGRNPQDHRGQTEP